MSLEAHPWYACTILVSDVDNGGDYACVGVGVIWQISVPSSQLYSISKISLKNKIFRGARVAQVVKHLTLHFGSGHNIMVL